MRWLSIAVALAGLLSANPEEKHQKKPATASENTQSSLTGCLDQRGERYILASEADMSKVTALKAKGMSDDNLALHWTQSHCTREAEWRHLRSSED